MKTFISIILVLAIASGSFAFGGFKDSRDSKKEKKKKESMKDSQSKTLTLSYMLAEPCTTDYPGIRVVVEGQSVKCDPSSQVCVRVISAICPNSQNPGDAAQSYFQNKDGSAGTENLVVTDVQNLGRIALGQNTISFLDNGYVTKSIDPTTRNVYQVTYQVR
jgi:hypothetical protein